MIAVIKMKIYVDADGCPVVRICAECAEKYGVKCVIVSDTSHLFDIEGAECIVVSKGADSADFYIANSASKGDVVVTQDYGLAAMCLARGAYVLTQNALMIDGNNIDALLYSRYSAKMARNAGQRIKGPAPRRAEQNEEFRKSLIRLLLNIIDGQ